LYGLDGTKHEWCLFDRFSDYLKNDFDVFSIDFRGSKQNDCISQDKMTLTTLKEDVEFVFHFLKKEYEEVFVVGLSLGAVSYLISDVNFDKAILWSPGNLKVLWKRYEKNVKYMTELDEKEYFDKGDILIGKEFYDSCEFKTLKSDAKKKTCPVLIIHCTKDDVIPYKKSVELIKEFSANFKSVHLIKDSDHNFKNPVFEKELFNLSKSFLLKKF